MKNPFEKNQQNQITVDTCHLRIIPLTYVINKSFETTIDLQQEQFSWNFR